MTLKDYMELKERAEKAGVQDSSALKQLLHIIQTKNVAIRNHKHFLQEMNEWEKNIAKCVEQEIKEKEND